GLSSNSGGRFTPPGAPLVGVYESSDGGATWTPRLIEPQDTVNPTSPNGSDFFRGGVTKIEFDPTHAGMVYASMFGYGLFRSTANGASFENFFAATVSATAQLSIRYEFDAVALPGGNTRIYLGAGYNEVVAAGQLTAASELFRVDDASTPAADLTTGGTN